MSDWRHRVKYSKWRFSKRVNQQSLTGDVEFDIEAEIGRQGVWEVFATVSMDVAGEGAGEDVARHIVEMHNNNLGVQ